MGKNLRQTGGRPHPCNVRHSGTPSLLRPRRRRASFIFQRLQFLAVNLVCFLSVLSLLATVPTLAQNARKDGSPASSNDPSPSLDVLADPPGLLYQGVPAEIPQDEGMAGLRLELLRLGTTARLMQVVAHPDDEDG